MRRKWNKVWLVVLALTVTSASIAGIDTSSWTRGIEDNSDISKRPFRSFVLLSVSSIDGHLIAGAVFMNPKESLVELEGTNGADGNFWIRVTAEVANDAGGRWKSIGVSTSKTAVLTVPARATSKPFNIDIDMDSFRPFIGKFKYGRVVLKSGEIAMFNLANLLPRKLDS